MEYLSNWVKNIVLVILFANFIEMLFPNNINKKDIQMISGLFVILAILTPVINLFNYQERNISAFNIFNYTTPSFQKIVKEGENMRIADNDVEDRYFEKISRQIEALVRMNSEFINVQVELKVSKKKELEEINIFISKEELEKVEIDLERDSKEVDQIKELISAFYGLDVDKIVVMAN